jgi:hypothetical protein
MSERNSGRFEILIENGDGRTDRDFLIEVVTGESWAAQKVAGLNATMERDNPREYIQGRRYYYRVAGT